MNNIININGRAIERIDYKDQPIVTLPMVDDLHERKVGTARRNFNQNKKHMIEGEDYYIVPHEEYKTLFDRTNFVRSKGGSRVEMIFLTKSGYGMLVKSFNDDLAWQIQRALVNHYFTSQPMVSTERQQPDIKLTIDIGRLAKQADTHLDGKASLRLLNHLTGIQVNDLIHEIEVKGLETARSQLKDAELVAAHLFAVLHSGDAADITYGTDDEGRKTMLCTTAVMLSAMDHVGKSKRLPKLGFTAVKLGNFFGRHMLELEGLGWRRVMERMVNGNRFFRYTCLEVEE